MIKVNGFNNTPLFIAKNKIMGAEERKGFPDETVILMGCGDHSEDWIIKEPIAEFLRKYEDEP